MKRIFYYSGYRLTIFHWQDEKCISTYAFNPGEDGLDKFKTYLKATANTPVRILVDLIEEDFNKETIPHVGSADRKSIINRLVERQYRNSQDYFYYKVIGREASGRRDDKILCCVLSNPDILQPWLEPMREAGTAISGIWSLPLLSEKLFEYINNKSSNILVVSQQVPSNLRQTLVKNGRFESSRSAVVNLADTSIGEYISTEVEQTIRFLSNQRYIGFDDKIEIHIICRDTDISEIQSYCVDSGLLSFHYHSLTKIEKDLKCQTQSEEYSNGIYSYICASIKLPIGHYGNANIFSRYYQQLCSNFLYIASILILILSGIFSLSYISESYIFDDEVITLKNQTMGINKDYQKQLSAIEHKLKLAQAMQSSVLLTEKIQTSKLVSPQNFMVDVSRILTRSGMHDTEISKLNWRQNQYSDFQSTNTNNNIKLIDYGKPDAINQVAVISGFIHVSQSSLKEAVDKINSIADAFRNNKLISKLRLNKVPVDVRSRSSIENESSNSQQLNSRDDSNTGRFEIEIIMNGRKS